MQHTVNRFNGHIILRRKLHRPALGLHDDRARRRDQAHALLREDRYQIARGHGETLERAEMHTLLCGADDRAVGGKLHTVT
ncbi:hypothetical protein R75483_07863 [Paraburkholderia domus]|nr:hypothetical protein R75483_07863 [Paraburkholderia domus]